MRTLFLALCMLLITVHPSAAQQMVFLIRHAEKELSGEDPALTPEGLQRAANWSEMLKSVGLDAVITSDARRTRETGGIVAESLGLTQSAWPRADVAGLIDMLEFDHEEDAVLIVGHAETIPSILENLGMSNEIEIGQSEFDNLFVLFRPSAGNSVLVHMRMP